MASASEPRPCSRHLLRFVEAFAGDALAEDEIAQAYFAAACTVAARCGVGDGFLVDQATCAAEIGAFVNDGSTFRTPFGLQASVKAGVITLDGVKALDCFDALSNRTACSENVFQSNLRGLAACADAFVGTLAPGESCIVDEACAGSAACLRTSDESACDARCFARPENGCLSDDECDTNTCLFDDGPFGTCATRGGVGTLCPSGNPGFCDEDLICQWTDRGEGNAAFTCITPPGLDEPCNEACAPGLACVNDDGGRFCRARPDTVDAVCQPDSGCAGDLACENLAPEARCVALPVEGEACAFNAFRPCAGGHFCDVDGTCQPVGEAGDTCITNEGCVEGLDCLSDQCVLLPATELADCSATSACGGGFLCLADEVGDLFCRTTQIGSPCGGSCSSGQICDFSAEPWTCKALPVEGDCINGTCAEGSFCDYDHLVPTCVVLLGVGEPCQHGLHLLETNSGRPGSPKRDTDARKPR